ncbi:helix-turn-helix domain-containing protein [Streptomyces sp. NPDC015220]|uniref:AraC-like ligand-binding domain-containing protein n=1 Tax=Streptomyces sp. NPDC015220 TaxID=3364947 RepID=UPI0036FC8626
MSLVLTTDSVPDEDKLAYWRAAVGRALVPMAVTPRAEGPIAGRIVTAPLGYIRVSAVEADAQRASRTAAHIARSPQDFVAVSVQMRGTATLVQDGRRACAGEKDIVVYDTTRPYSLTYPERFAARVVHLPRRALGLSDEQLHRITGTAIGTTEGVGSVLMPFLASLVASAHTCSPAVAGKLAANVVDFFATLVAERTRPGAVGADSARSRLVLRVRDHIDRNLGDPALSPAAVATAHHISVRYLHRLFEDEGVTVGRLIQRRRLEESARELTRGGRTAPAVSAVAQRWGFVNPAHFSRVFRTFYGHSPLEWRNLRLTEGADASRRPARRQPRDEPGPARRGEPGAERLG